MSFKTIILCIALVAGSGATSGFSTLMHNMKSGIVALEACTENGAVTPVAGECTNYNICINGNLITFTCGDGFYFDGTYGYCREDVSNVCGVVYDCATEETGSVIPLEGACSRYQLCITGASIVLECDTNQFFNGELGYCTYDHEGVCWKGGTTAQPITTTKGPTDAPVTDTTTEAPTTTEEPPVTDDTTEAPVSTEEPPVTDDTTEAPISTEGPPVTDDTTEAPVSTEEPPVTDDTTEVPVSTKEPPVTDDTTEAPVSTEEPPVTDDTTEAPVSTEEPPVTNDTTEAPVSTEEPPVTDDTTEAPVSTEEPPVTDDTTEAPVSTEEPPVTDDTTEAPVSTEEPPVTDDTTEAPISTEKPPVTDDTTEAPVSTEEPPVTNDTTEAPVSTEEPPVTDDTTEAPVSTEEPPVTDDTTEAPVSTEEPPVTDDTTKAPVSTEEPPVTDDTTEAPISTEKPPVTDDTTEAPVTTEEPPVTDDTTEAPVSTEEPPVTDDTTEAPTSTEEPPVTDDTTKAPVSTEEPPVTDDTTEAPVSTEDPPVTDDTTEAPVSTEEPPATDDTTETPTSTPTSTSTSTTTQKPDICEGKPYGTVAHQDCDTYYLCDDGVATVEICPEGKYFDAEAEECVPNDNSVCSTKCLRMADGTRFPDDSNCHWYFECLSSIEISESCLTGEYFDSETLSCVDDVDNTCGSASPNACQDQADGTIISHGECESYFVCQNNEDQVFYCDSGYRFDIETSMCVEDSSYTCFCELNPEGVFASNACNEYFKCSSGSVSITTCPEGEYFDADTLSCLDDANDTCVA